MATFMLALHDLLMPGQTHTVMSLVDPSISDRLVMMTAATKTFNIAGSHVGNVIIEDEALRAKFAGQMAAMGMSPNSFGVFMTTAAYSPEGAAWVTGRNIELSIIVLGYYIRNKLYLPLLLYSITYLSHCVYKHPSITTIVREIFISSQAWTKILLIKNILLLGIGF